MVSFENLKEYSTEFPSEWTFLWSREEADKISSEHKDQIFFLNEEATSFINRYFESSKIRKNSDEPVSKDYFKNIETYKININLAELKKWLFDGKIAFDNFVFIDSDDGRSIMLTWRMVIKYCEGIFFSEDIYIFDTSLNGTLFYYHESELTFQKKFTQLRRTNTIRC